MKVAKHNARLIALNILCEQKKNRVPLDLIMEHHLREAALPDTRDNRLIMALVYGVMRQRRYLDWIITAVASHPLKKMKPRTVNALRLGVLQLFFMNKIPASAAIDEIIKALKKSRQPKWLINFSNGVLRNIDRKEEELKQRAAAQEPAVRSSHPDWLFARWQKRFGSSRAKEICRINNTTPHLTLRINRQKTSSAEFLGKLAGNSIKARPGKFSRNSIHLDYRGEIKNLPGYEEGFFHVQDEAAQLVAHLFNPLKQGNYLDCCAGSGGKTMQLAAMIPPGSTLYAVEPHKSRVKQLRTNLNRLNFSEMVSIFAMTLEKFAGMNRILFDYILVDAPCSGLGVIRRHPDIRWNRQPGDLVIMARTQLKLLEIAAGMLAPDGSLVYATCTTEPEENEEVINRFSSDNPQLEIVGPALIGKAADLVDKNNFFHTLPSADYDGFFAVKFIKNDKPTKKS